MMDSRATHEVKTDARRLCTVKLPDAIDRGDWVAVHRLAERLMHLAQCGLHHASKDMLPDLAKLCRISSEPEAR